MVCVPVGVPDVGPRAVVSPGDRLVTGDGGLFGITVSERLFLRTVPVSVVTMCDLPGRFSVTVPGRLRSRI